jgi:hypothetical protein
LAESAGADGHVGAGSHQERSMRGRREGRRAESYQQPKPSRIAPHPKLSRPLTLQITISVERRFLSRDDRRRGNDMRELGVLFARRSMHAFRPGRLRIEWSPRSCRLFGNPAGSSREWHRAAIERPSAERGSGTC